MTNEPASGYPPDHNFYKYIFDHPVNLTLGKCQTQDLCSPGIIKMLHMHHWTLGLNTDLSSKGRVYSQCATSSRTG